MRCYLEDFNLLSSTCCKMEMSRSVVFDRTSYPPLSRLSALQSTYNSLIPVDTNAYICSVAPCLRVLWMSTHGCFLLLFPISLLPGCRNQMLEPRSQTPPSTTTPTTPEVPTTTCCPLTTTRSSLGGSQAGGMRLFRSVSQFVLAFLRQTCLTYVCTQILLLPLTRL